MLTSLATARTQLKMMDRWTHLSDLFNHNSLLFF
jgi:hypothetical protein